jgi:hypothetical protein
VRELSTVEAQADIAEHEVMTGTSSEGPATLAPPKAERERLAVRILQGMESGRIHGRIISDNEETAMK